MYPGSGQYSDICPSNSQENLEAVIYRYINHLLRGLIDSNSINIYLTIGNRYN